MKKIPYLLTLLLMLGFVSCQEEAKEENFIAKTQEKEPVQKQYGFVLNDYQVIRDTVKPGDSFGEIMNQYGVDAGKVFEITKTVTETFDPRLLVVGKAYTILRSKDSLKLPEIFVYESNPIEYTVVSLGENVAAYKGQKPVTIKHKTASGIITSSLSGAMDNEGLGIVLSDMMADIYRWKIDFFRLQKGDQFKLIYNEKYINDTVYAGIKNIEAAVFVHNDETFYAFQFGKDSISGSDQYYDQNGGALQSFFLKAPVDFTRISSRYQKSRYHPVLKTWRSHKGTDYAAPTGTPIWSTANGRVIVSGYTSGNGKYVKIRHNSKYTTQYLHMSKRAVSRGEYVKQGDIIGYVGSTGLATGPHVCYRFWVNGRQVDPYKQDLPSSKPLAEELLPEFKEKIAPLKRELDSVEFKTLPATLL
ncbi:MAG TPA: peptidoglycan DD-metalloendopeptidase family protein [Flavobacteriaceae bacterium]|nr:peptidoglycan DD-metalloendopeptidase family protein [Flavobacteriaceae bacterium]